MVIVTVGGPEASGKSAIAQVITQVLGKLEFDVTIDIQCDLRTHDELQVVVAGLVAKHTKVRVCEAREDERPSLQALLQGLAFANAEWQRTFNAMNPSPGIWQLSDHAKLAEIENRIAAIRKEILGSK